MGEDLDCDDDTWPEPRPEKDTLKATGCAEKDAGVRVAFVSSYIAPYTFPSRLQIDVDPRITARHFFARKQNPARQWKIRSIPETFTVVRTFALRIFGQRVLLPVGLLGALKKFRPHIIVTEQFGGLSLAVVIYAKTYRIPVLLHWEGTVHTESIYSYIRHRFRRWLASKMAGFICYTDEAVEYLKTLDAEGAYYRIPCSVCDEFRGPRSYERRPNIVLYVGGLIHRKGVDLLLDAFTRVVVEQPTAQLWIVGDGPLRKPLEERVTANVAERITWFGFCDTAQTAQLYRQASVFVCPTRSDCGPLVLIEAARSGLPIISSPFAGASKLIVETGKNGFIVDPNDVTNLVQAMLNILRSDNLDRMAAKSIELGKPHSPKLEARLTADSIIDCLTNYEK